MDKEITSLSWEQRRDLFDRYDDDRAALASLARSARYAAALGEVPEAERDALKAVARWADKRLVATLAWQTALLPPGAKPLSSPRRPHGSGA